MFIFNMKESCPLNYVKTTSDNTPEFVVTFEASSILYIVKT